MKTTFNSICGAAVTLAAAMGCGSSAPLSPDAARDAGVDAPSAVAIAAQTPITGLSSDQLAQFAAGEGLFATTYADADGLGPLYIHAACSQCHADASRGPGFVQKMAVVEADGVTASPDQSALPFGHTVRLGLAAGATTPIEPPAGNPSVLVTSRVPPQLFGRGYLEAIDETQIEAQQTAQAARTDAIHGVIDQVTYESVPNPNNMFGTFTMGETGLVGRFGLKARQPSVDDFAADALQGDMGMTTPMRPTELPNPDGLTDDDKPGVDLDQPTIDGIAFYVRTLAIPPRAAPDPNGVALFAQVQCDVCHVPSLHTQTDYPISELADIDAPVFTDMLLHEMGSALADGQTDQSADSFGWRTAPLIGERLTRAYLHDGRATTIADAIADHAGEAQASHDAFMALSSADQATLIAYVESL